MQYDILMFGYGIIDQDISIIENNMRTFYLILIICIFYSCANKPDYFSEEFNQVRDSIGLSQLSLDWPHIPPEEGEEIGGWKNINIDADSIYTIKHPFHWCKQYRIRDGTVLLEGDIFFGNDIYTTDHGINREHLVYTYHFVEWEDFSIGGSYLYYGDPKKDLNWWCITKEKADSILTSWGLKYP